jgi:hypothetical protein
MFEYYLLSFSGSFSAKYILLHQYVFSRNTNLSYFPDLFTLKI